MVVATGSGGPTPPWRKAKELVQSNGMNIALFGFPGAGKTTLASTAKRALLFDIDGTAARSLADRDDIDLFPVNDSFDRVETLSDQLRQRSHPFDTIIFDTMTKLSKLAVQKIRGNQNLALANVSQNDWGQANAMVMKIAYDWCAVARETGTNVIFVLQAEELKDDSSGFVFIRMSATPGVVKDMLAAVDTVGYLEADRQSSARKLLLKPTARVIAKHHQPMTGPQLPLEIKNPDIQEMIDISRGHTAAAKEVAAAASTN